MFHLYGFINLSLLEQRVSPIRSLREKEQQKKATEIESTSQVNHISNISFIRFEVVVLKLTERCIVFF